MVSDPNVEWKRQKLAEVQKKGAKTALTKKRPAMTASNKKNATRKKAAVAKMAPWHPSVDVEDDHDTADDQTSNGDDNMSDDNPAPDTITIDDDEVVEVPEAPEESAEAELSMCVFFFLGELIMI